MVNAMVWEEETMACLLAGYATTLLPKRSDGGSSFLMGGIGSDGSKSRRLTIWSMALYGASEVNAAAFG